MPPAPEAGGAIDIGGWRDRERESAVIRHIA
jgi:hypothetical protein